MPRPFTGPKMFCPNFLSQPKNLTAFTSASSKTFVPSQRPILPNANQLFVWQKFVGDCYNMYINFWYGTKNLDQPKTFWGL